MHGELGAALLRTGRTSEAVTSLKTALDLNPKNSTATVTLIKALYRSDSDESKEYSSRLKVLKQQESAVMRARVLSNFALQAAERGDWETAFGHFDEAIDVCGNCAVQATLHKNFGLVLADSQDFEGALRELHAAREIESDPDIEYALAIVERARDRQAGEPVP